MVANCHAGRAVALLEGADEEWNEVQDMEILEAARNEDGMHEGEDDFEEEDEEVEDPLVAYFSQPQVRGESQVFASSVGIVGLAYCVGSCCCRL